LPNTSCRHFAPKVVHMDLAVNTAHFPRIKKSFNPPGRRKFVYIGARGHYKNIPYLNQVAGLMQGTDFGWFGPAKPKYQHLRPLGSVDFSLPEAQVAAAEFDFLITVGWADANPTTILEAMSWGLIPVCTRQSGYEGIKGIFNVPLNDPRGAVEVLKQMQSVEDGRLMELQRSNWDLLASYYNWDRFAGQVIDAIESDASPALKPCRMTDALTLAWFRIISPQSRWRATKLKARFRQWLAGLGSGTR